MAEPFLDRRRHGYPAAMAAAGYFAFTATIAVEKGESR